MKKVICINDRYVVRGGLKMGQVYSVESEYTGAYGSVSYVIDGKHWGAYRFKLISCPCNIAFCIGHKKVS